ncbi:hypothetical protein [Gelidibacter maritimus]|uniref:Uncharacterized protein n=1 Tax=Gelidibacter maritimus TaxID=2761487 RepID=A0A7W2M685_9FLAO|nr:hypothetical protein [Gelidibacter maritimus]MBA6153246.1 hypothetical protein [Gelidibacter maritimus]
MKQLITDRNLIIINSVIILYFFGIYILYKYQVDIVIIGVFQEMLSIPFMLAQIIFIIIGIHHLVKHKIKILTLISVIALAICLTITVGSFF